MRSYNFLLLAVCVMSHNDGSLVTRLESNFLPKSHDCALPEMKEGKFVCPDQSVSIKTRRTMEEFEPFDEINGQRLDDFWPATPSTHVGEAQHWNHDGIRYSRYQLMRKAGERSPIHIHENAQVTCLTEGKVMFFQEGEEPSVHEAPGCILMRPFVKMSALSLTDKIETELFHVPEGGLDWVVLEPKYYHMQGQWDTQEEMPSSDEGMKAPEQHQVGPASDRTRLGRSPRLCPSHKCPIFMDGSLACVPEFYTVEAGLTYPASYCPPTRDGYPGQAQCLTSSMGSAWTCVEM